MLFASSFKFPREQFVVQTAKRIIAAIVAAGEGLPIAIWLFISLLHSQFFRARCYCSSNQRTFASSCSFCVVRLSMILTSSWRLSARGDALEDMRALYGFSKTSQAQNRMKTACSNISEASLCASVDVCVYTSAVVLRFE
jgi:hypothetical protein